MPNLQSELHELVIAEEHVAQAEAALARLEGVQRRGVPLDETEQKLLRTTKESLLEFRKHRDLIVETIADLRAGRLPST